MIGGTLTCPNTVLTLQRAEYIPCSGSTHPIPMLFAPRGPLLCRNFPYKPGRKMVTSPTETPLPPDRQNTSHLPY